MPCAAWRLLFAARRLDEDRPASMLHCRRAALHQGCADVNHHCHSDEYRSEGKAEPLPAPATVLVAARRLQSLCCEPSRQSARRARPAHPAVPIAPPPPPPAAAVGVADPMLSSDSDDRACSGPGPGPSPASHSAPPSAPSAPLPTP
eukprot:366350-Chlamydomonas_euryale.AAC.2